MTLDHILDKYFMAGEDWPMLCDRVSSIHAYKNERELLYEALVNKQIMPSSPILVNGGRGGGRNLMACHVVHVPNSVVGIMDTAKWSAQIFKSGGGIGLDFSALSPRDTKLSYSTGKASGPVSFMQVYNSIAQVVMEGGLRRAAMMATLNAAHPDILEFAMAKTKDGELSNFNVSVTIDGGPDSVSKKTWHTICHQAYANGEPGVVFLDRVNRYNHLHESHGRIIAVNACSEQPLYNFGSCVLGHIVLPKVIAKLGEYNKLRGMTKLMVRLLDRVIDVNHYPLPQIAEVARDIRNIGVGVMGWNDLLVANGIPFVSQDALALAREIGKEVYRAADEESWRLAEEKGGYRPGCRRNSFLTTIAPTGHTARLTGVEHSINPPYAEGLRMTPEEHLNHIAVWQTNMVDSAISYTISFQNDAPQSIVDRIFRGAWERGLKAISVYRDGSREGQPCKVDGTCDL